MLKKFLNGVAWLWMTAFMALYLYICITEGVVHAMECSSLDEFGTFATALASLVLITNKFVIPSVQKIEMKLASIARKHRHKKMFTSYMQVD